MVSCVKKMRPKGTTTGAEKGNTTGNKSKQVNKTVSATLAVLHTSAHLLLAAEFH